jgi:polyphenol oxidase
MPRFDQRQGLEFLLFDEFAHFGLDAVVTTRRGGVSSSPFDSLNLGLHVGDDPDLVIENRRRVARAIDVELDHMVFMNQTHGARVGIVDNEMAGRGAQFEENALISTDAMVTTVSDLPLVVLVADCCPLIFLDPTARILGVAHAGWRGVSQDIVGETVGAMSALGADVERLQVAIGPSIERERYEVGDEVIGAIRPLVDVSHEEVVDRSGHRPYLDVARANAELMVSHGIPREHIVVSPIGTGDRRFFSDRASRPCGRFALIATLVS